MSVIKALVLYLVISSCSPMVYNQNDPGVPNLEQVDEGVYRSGQISSEVGWDTISHLANGRHLVVIKLNFENEGSDRQAAARRGFELIELPIQPQGDRDLWDDVRGLLVEPDQAKVDAAIRRMSLCRARHNFEMCLVHCTHGQDRTGLVVGEYRVNEGWAKNDAWQEMRNHHFHWEIAGLMRAWEEFKRK